MDGKPGASDVGRRVTPDCNFKATIMSAEPLDATIIGKAAMRAGR